MPTNHQCWKTAINNYNSKNRKIMKTIILKWNPAISCVSMEDMKWAVQELWNSLESDFNWSIYDWEKAEKGDRVFMLRVGRGKVGIIASGWLSSDAYEGEDWRGTDEKRHYADILFDVMIHPQRNNILDTKVLQKEIPTVDWKGGHSGVVISEEEAARLESVWNNFLKENAHLFEPETENTFNSLLVRAWGIAINAHKGQVDKAGKDYFTSHVMDVYEKVTPLYDEDYNICITDIVALLHDVVEDTDWTIDALREQGFTEEILEALMCVTKKEGESYERFVERSKSNRFAREVKIADLRSNMDITRLNEITDKDVERLRKYHKAYKFLSAE